MILNIWESIRNFFSNLFTKVSWTSILLLLTGIVIGFIICGISYLIIVLTSIKKVDKKNEQIVYSYTHKEDVNNFIRGAKDEYKEESEYLTFNQKIECIKNISFQLIKDIAKIYYPDSKYPIYEISIEELIVLSRYITERIENVFQGRILKKVEKIKISTIFNFLDKKKQIEDSKIVKAAEKTHIGSIAKMASNVLNAVNPVHWIKKTMISGSINIGTNKIANIIIDIVGNETAKVYSKNLFNDNSIEEELKILNSIEKE